MTVLLCYLTCAPRLQASNTQQQRLGGLNGHLNDPLRPTIEQTSSTSLGYLFALCIYHQFSAALDAGVGFDLGSGMCVGGIRDSGSRPISNSSRRYRHLHRQLIRPPGHNIFRAQ
jgi:hypothetical protein